MNREDVLKSVKLKKRFCKDRSLSISVFEEPYFMQRLNTLDKFDPCLSEFYTFVEEMERFENEQAYFEYYNAVKDAAIKAINENPKMVEFKNSPDKDKWYEVNSKAAKQKNLYIEPNDGHTFISIDMCKANFSAVRHYSPEIFGGATTWYEFMSRFTDLEHIRGSKYIRQVIMGACNPKVQTQYELYLMATLLLHIESKLHLNVYSLATDELILDVSAGEKWSLNKLREVIEDCPDGIGELVRVEMFNLNQLRNGAGWYKIMYQFDDPLADIQDDIVLKCVESDIYHQVIKHYFDEEITEDDLVFYHNGKLAKYLEGIEDPW